MRVEVRPFCVEERDLKFTNDSPFYTDYEEENLGTIPIKLGKQWLQIEITGWTNSHQSIEIITSLDDELNGTVAIFSPNSDYYSVEAHNRQRTLDYNPVEETPNMYVECKSWDLGKESRLTLHRSPETKEDLSFKLLLLLRPRFFKIGDKCKIKFNIIDKKVSNNSSLDEESLQGLSLLDEESLQRLSEYELICSNELTTDKVEKMGYVHDVLNRYNAYNYDGGGNSLHPKQYLTIRGLEHIMNQFLDGKNDIKIGYIGTDTTENFCSMMRWLETSGMIDRVSKIEAWYTNEWDWEFLQSLDDSHPLKCHRKVKPFEISPNLIEQANSCDIIISTYVSPFVGLHSNSYQELLTKLVEANSYLLSVDPQNAEKSVRLPLDVINNQILYKNILSFIVAKAPVTKENLAVEWSVWKRRKSTTGAN